MNKKNRGRSKKTERQTAPKSSGGNLPVGAYLQRDSTPPAPCQNTSWLIRTGI